MNSWNTISVYVLRCMFAALPFCLCKYEYVGVFISFPLFPVLMILLLACLSSWPVHYVLGRLGFFSALLLLLILVVYIPLKSF